jgi:hypothetical protein
MSALTSVEAGRSSQRNGMDQDQDRGRDEEGQTLRRPWEQAVSGHCGEKRLAKLRCRHTEAEEGSARDAG